MYQNKIKLEEDWSDKSLPKITRALPFFKSDQGGKYFHRVRAMSNHMPGNKMHTAVTLWCGMHCFVGSGKGRLYPKTSGVRCAVCEGKAIGAGEDGKRIINTKAVMYKPTKD